MTAPKPVSLEEMIAHQQQTCSQRQKFVERNAELNIFFSGEPMGALALRFERAILETLQRLQDDGK